MVNVGSTYHDEFFGVLTVDKENEWFTGTVNLKDDVAIEVTLVPKSSGELEQFVRESQKRFVQLKSKLGEIYASMREEYLKLYNDSWAQVMNGYGEPVGHGKISKEQFNDFVGLESIWFESDGSVELFFYDNDELFGGHSIHIWLDQKLSIKGTGLEG